MAPQQLKSHGWNVEQAVDAYVFVSYYSAHLFKSRVIHRKCNATRQWIYLGHTIRIPDHPLGYSRNPGVSRRRGTKTSPSDVLKKFDRCIVASLDG